MPCGTEERKNLFLDCPESFQFKKRCSLESQEAPYPSHISILNTLFTRIYNPKEYSHPNSPMSYLIPSHFIKLYLCFMLEKPNENTLNILLYQY
jgi:hypothetical protein